jgi:hypothetical protein
MNPQVQAAIELHRHLVARHWDGHALIGPDPGVRFNYRIGRFVKGYLPAGRWRDALYYLQGQGYWVLGNWRLFALTGEERFRDIAIRCSARMLQQQRDDGAWEYPNPEWAGRVATAEGTWGAIGLLASYQKTGDPRFLDGAVRWHAYVVARIGFQQLGDTLAVNYFADRRGERVPNNSAFFLRFLASLADATGDAAYLRPCSGLLGFLRDAQAPTGEFPYTVPGEGGESSRPHFQCFQYNAYQCLDLIHYYRTSGDVDARPIIDGVLRFLPEGLAADGHAYYECDNRYRSITYHAAALGAAFARASEMGIVGHGDLARRAYAFLLRSQRPDGGFAYSSGDYRVLSDRRSYPRYLAMILDHLLEEPMVEQGGTTDRVGKEEARGVAC